jgi:hypothetical protein
MEGWRTIRMGQKNTLCGGEYVLSCFWFRVVDGCICWDCELFDYNECILLCMNYVSVKVMKNVGLIICTSTLLNWLDGKIGKPMGWFKTKMCLCIFIKNPETWGLRETRNRKRRLCTVSRFPWCFELWKSQSTNK